MIIPEYLEQVVISNRRRRRHAKAGVRRGAAFGETPVTTVIWAALDFLSVIVAGLISFRIWLTPQVNPTAAGVILRHLEETAPLPSIICLVAFAAYLVICNRTLLPVAFLPNKPPPPGRAQSTIPV